MKPRELMGYITEFILNWLGHVIMFGLGVGVVLLATHFCNVGAK